MTNPGVAPPADDNVGDFRRRYGDVLYVPLVPDVPGFGDYTELSDAEIEAFLAGASDSVPRAIGDYYGRLAGDAAKITLSVKDHDLAEDNTKRYEALLKMSDYWYLVADREDNVEGLLDIFEVADPPFSTSHYCPEAAPCARCSGVYVF